MPDTGGNIIFSADAEAPATKLFALLENDPKFRMSWENRRPDFVGKSPSEYDFSLASMAFYSDWTDQEVVDLLIHWRRMHGHPLKLRENYYTTTLAKAKQPVDLSNAQDRLEKAIFAPNPSSKGPEIIGTLTDIFKIPIQKIIRYAGDPPTYALSTDKADITLGTIGSITSQVQFRNAVAAATGILIPKCKEKEWDQRAQAVLSACVTVDLGDSSHPSQQVLTWLHDYLADKPPAESIQDALSTKMPFKRADNTYIFLDNFRRWVEFASDTRLTSHEMAQRLSKSGAMAEAIPCTVGQKKTTRSCWRLTEQP